MIDELTKQAGGYFDMPSEENIAYTDLLFDVYAQFGILYYSTIAKARYFVEAATRVA